MLHRNLMKTQYTQALPSWRGLMLCATSVLILAACGGGTGGTVTTSGPNSDAMPVIATANSAETVQALTPADTVKADGTKTADVIVPIETIAPIPTPMETFRALAPQQGLKITPLFAQPVADESSRIKRVEDAVQGMRNDFDTIMPTMVRMASMEKDMRGLIDKLQVLTGEIPPDQTPVKENPEEAEGEPLPLTQELVDPLARNSIDEINWTDIDDIDVPHLAAKAAAVSNGPVTVTRTETTTVTTKTDEVVHQIEGAPSIKAIRIADHPDSTRIVLDMTAKAAIPPGNFQNDNKQLVLDLPQINWTAKTESVLKSSGLVSGYKYENGKLTLTLTRAAEIKGQQSLPPEGSGGYRFVLDLKAKA